MKHICRKCKIEKECSCFWRCSLNKNGLQIYCKDCLREYRKLPTSIENRHKRREANIEKYLESMRRFRVKKQASDPKYRINNSMGSNMWQSLRYRKGGRGWQDLAGYTLKELMEHLERQFDEKMSWDNYGVYWHIDHIKPKSMFSYSSTDDKEFKDCWALSNLRPLEAQENRKKSRFYKLK